MTVKLDHITCPTCGKKGTWQPENKFKPFCSDRCKLIDLGDWADEKHRVAGEAINPNPPSDDENAE